MHTFAYFVISGFSANYHQLEQDHPVPYTIGAIVGTLFFGLLLGNILHKKIYLTISFINLCTISYVLSTFIMNEDLEISEDSTQELLSGIVGFLLETSSFIYTWLLPLKIAKDITDKKLKSFDRSYLDPNTHSFVGTVVGVCVGATYIANVVIFSNLNFLFK